MSSGTGEYVYVEDGQSTPSAPRTLDYEKFEETNAFAREWNTLSKDKLEEMSTLLRELELPEGWETALQDIVISDVPPMELFGRPSLGILTLPDDWPTSFPLAPLLKDAPTIDLGYAKPTKPTAVN